MDVDAAGPWVEGDQLLRDLADPDNGALQNGFDAGPLLRMDDLVVAGFQLFIDIDVLDVQARVVLEPFILRPAIADGGLGLWQFLTGHMLDLDLLLEVVHGVRPYLIVVLVRHRQE